MSACPSWVLRSKRLEMLSKRTQEHFRNKVIWITGASSGIGRALTISLSNTDCEIYISGRSQERLQETVNQCKHKHKIHILKGDLSEKQTNLHMCNHILNNSGYLDIAILNAGTCEYVDINNFESDLFERLIKNNYLSMVYGIEACLPLLESSKNPQLVGMSSTAAYLGLPRAEAYGSTKAAIRNLFRALKVSLKNKGISVSVICPGFVKTELTDKNDFSMPGLISATKASEYILKGIAREKHEIHFPKRFSYSLKLLALLPDAIQFHLLSKTIK